MTKINLNGCSFKPIELRKPKTNVSKHTYRIKTYCICSEVEPNKFKAFVNIPSKLEYPDTLCIDFTENSYNLKGKLEVYTTHKDKRGNSMCIIRTETDSIHFPGLPSQYTPFKNNYVYSGYVINVRGKLQFEIKEVLGNKNYYKNLVSNIRLKDDEEI